MGRYGNFGDVKDTVDERGRVFIAREHDLNNARVFDEHRGRGERLDGDACVNVSKIWSLVVPFAAAQRRQRGNHF